MDSTLKRRHAAFKVRGDTGPANVILSLWLAHAARCLVSAAHVRKTTSAQLQPCTAIDSLTGRPNSATWVVHYTRRMQEINNAQNLFHAPLGLVHKQTSTLIQILATEVRI